MRKKNHRYFSKLKKIRKEIWKVGEENLFSLLMAEILLAQIDGGILLAQISWISGWRGENFAKSF